MKDTYKQIKDGYESLGIKLFIFNISHINNWSAKEKWIQELLKLLGKERMRTDFLNRSLRRYGSVSRARKSFAKALQNQRRLPQDDITPRVVKAVHDRD